MENLLLIAVFLAFLLATLLLSKRGRGGADNFLAAYFIVSAVTILLSFVELHNRKNGYPYPAIINASPPFILLHGPALWFYIRSLTTQNFKLRAIHFLHLIPFALVFSLFIAEFYSYPIEERIALDSSDSVRTEPLFYIVVGLIALSTQGYYIWGSILIREYQKKLKLFLSQVESIDLHWLRFLLISAIVFYASVSGLYILDILFELLPYNLLQLSGFAMASVFVFVLGFFGLRQGNVFASYNLILNLEGNGDTIAREKNLSNQDEAFVHKLLSHMRERKTHVNPELTIAMLSCEMGVTTEYLSFILNGRLGMNFFDFVNHYRIEEFKAKCRDPQNQRLTLISLAYDCGFNSKATFNRVFKRAVGCTPSEYHKKI